MSEYIMNRESLKRHCEAMCKKFKDVPTSSIYGEHKLVLDLLEQTEWTPVSERPPKENKTVIASTKYDVYPETKYTKEYGWEWAYESGADYWKELKGVVAWMPLPPHYEPQEGSDKK